MDRIDEISSAIAAAVEEQGAITREIARNAVQAAAGMPAAVAQHDRRPAPAPPRPQRVVARGGVIR
ncbi:MAG: hypothetical protein EA406_00045 [Rhodospirillales bacterium]|nr:MAG: hypothetical protein EA406_00045 [Rhodospirillales bacterium]